jgi:hypothetical protein
MAGRTSTDTLNAVAVEDLVSALADANVAIRRKKGSRVEASFDRNQLVLEIVATAYATESRANELIDGHVGRDGTPVLVADRITRDARARLAEAGWGWFDRRGHLYLRAPGLFINTEAAPRARSIPRTDDPIRGRAGLSVAYRFLIKPTETISPTHNTLGFAPSTISVALSKLRDAALLDEVGLPVLPELFWAAADEWSPDRTWLATVPDPDEAGHELESPGWCASGTVAAAELGAPVVSTTSMPDLYVRSPVEVTIATRRYGVARDAAVAASSIAVAPVNDVAMHRRPPVDQPWPLAHPVAVALDLAQDRARGREILEDWSPPERVW